jgi:colanic acid/amylovoran biosynthesis glycosyltransferase
LKVVLVTNQFPKFSETFIVTKFVGLRALGWDVHVVCNRSDHDQWPLFADSLYEPDVRTRVHICPERRLVTEALREVHPDIVHFEFGGLTKNRTDLPGLVGARTVVSFRGPDLNVAWMDDPHLYDAVWAAADGYHFLGRDLHRRAIELGCPGGTMALIPPAVDTTFFDGHRPPHHEVAGSRERPLRILSVGRLHWMKGYSYGLRAIRTLLDQGIHCSYTIIGAHDHREHFLEILFDIEDLGLSDVVRLVGRQSRDFVRRQMASADVLLHAAVSEGFCNAVIEAQSMRLPVVTSDAGGLPDNVEHGRTGYVVRRRSPQALARRLRDLGRLPQTRAALGDAGRERAVQLFSLENYAARFDALYVEVLSGADDVEGRLRESLSAKEREVRALERRLPAAVRAQLDATRKNQCALHVQAATPESAVVAVASRGDDHLLSVLGRSAQHFPRNADGLFSGSYPANSSEAIEMVQAAHSTGAEYLAFPKTSLWWLDHYRDFYFYLKDEHLDLSGDPAECRIFRLNAGLPSPLEVASHA